VIEKKGQKYVITGFFVNVLLILSIILLGTTLIWSLMSRFVCSDLCVIYFKLLEHSDKRTDKVIVLQLILTDKNLVICVTNVD
jgi:hypothetical protein